MGWIIDLLKDIPLSAVVKEKLIDAEKKILVLEQQNEYLQTNLNQANKEIERLNQIINGMKAKKDDSKKHYDPVTEQILKQFFNAGKGLSINDFTSIMLMNISTIQYHFDILLQNGLITQTKAGFESSWTGESSPDMYDLTHDGRKYVIENIST